MKITSPCAAVAAAGDNPARETINALECMGYVQLQEVSGRGYAGFLILRRVEARS